MAGAKMGGTRRRCCAEGPRFFDFDPAMSTFTATFASAVLALVPQEPQTPAPAQAPAGASAPARGSLTIYNGDLALVRESLELDLQAGINQVAFGGITRRLEPSSVVLRGAAGTGAFQVLRQGYRNDPVSEGFLLSLFEGQVLEFLRPDGSTVAGRVVRSGYTPPPAPIRGFAPPEQGASSPVVEVDGKLRFELPGRPLFPSLGEDTVLEPTLLWELEAERAGRQGFELGYLTGGLAWQADYNIVLTEGGGPASAVGWVTLSNTSGTAFRDVDVQLVAGDVRRLDAPSPEFAMGRMAMSAKDVVQEAFDAYHLYTLPRALTLRSDESAQVEFLRSAALDVQTRYVARTQAPIGDFRREQNLFQLATTVEVMREFTNSGANGLGVPLPRGTLRFYRMDRADKMQFVGEAPLDHTPADEQVSVMTGRAFDLVAERRRVNFTLDENRRQSTETITIELRNRSRETAQIRVQEVLHRWHQNEVVESQPEARRIDASHIEFDVALAAGEVREVNYTVRYTW